MRRKERIYLYILGLIVLWFLCLNFFPFAENTEISPHLNQDLIKNLQKKDIKDEFSFVVLGDNRDGNNIFEKLLIKINNIEPKPLFIINTGDLVSKGKFSEYENFLKLIEKSEIPILTVPGNHDYIGEGEKFYLQIFGEPDYYFDLGGCRFIILDNARGILTDEQLKWVEKLLKTNLIKFVFIHMPPNYGVWKVHCFQIKSKEFMELMEKYKVDYVFCGHIHAYHTEEVNGVKYVITGGAGAPLYKFPGMGAFHHAVKIKVSKGEIKDELILLEENK